MIINQSQVNLTAHSKQQAGMEISQEIRRARTQEPGVNSPQSSVQVGEIQTLNANNVRQVQQLRLAGVQQSAQRQTLEQTLSNQALTQIINAGSTIQENQRFTINSQPITISSNISERITGVNQIEIIASRSFTLEQDLEVEALGKVTTEDGRDIEFAMMLNMRSKDESLSAASLGIRIDPLVINLEGGGARLGDTKFEFDLNQDGERETLDFVAQGSGFLAFDKNSDGKINDGGELFGATSGDGFAELAQYDDDFNQWIDENDAIFEKLSVWQKDEHGNDSLMSLKDLGVGAIYLDSAAGNFTLIKDGSVGAEIAASGIFLSENGTVGSIQHMNYVLPNNLQNTLPTEPNRSEAQPIQDNTLRPNRGKGFAMWQDRMTEQQQALSRMLEKVDNMEPVDFGFHPISLTELTPDQSFQGRSERFTLNWQSSEAFKTSKEFVRFELIKRQFESQQSVYAHIREAKSY